MNHEQFIQQLEFRNARPFHDTHNTVGTLIYTCIYLCCALSTALRTHTRTPADEPTKPMAEDTHRLSLSHTHMHSRSPLHRYNRPWMNTVEYGTNTQSTNSTRAAPTANKQQTTDRSIANNNNFSSVLTVEFVTWERSRVISCAAWFFTSALVCFRSRKEREWAALSDEQTKFSWKQLAFQVVFGWNSADELDSDIRWMNARWPKKWFGASFRFLFGFNFLVFFPCFSLCNFCDDQSILDSSTPKQFQQNIHVRMFETWNG